MIVGDPVLEGIHILLSTYYREHFLPRHFTLSLSCLAIDGSWGRWSEWDVCSVQCGDGYKKRFRKCDDPKPMRGGLYCPGTSEISEGCVMKRCVLGKDNLKLSCQTT